VKNLESLLDDPRLTVRRSGAPDLDGQCVVYWMQRAQRATDNPALSTAIQTGNLLGKPVVVFFQLLPHTHHANLRHYHFLVEGLEELAAELKKRRVGWVMRRYPDHGLLRFCTEARACLVIGDENPLKRAERSKAKIAAQIRVPFWTVDADVIVPTRLLGREHYAARTIRPKLHQRLKEFLEPVINPVAKFPWSGSSRVSSISTDLKLLDNFPVDRSVSPSRYFQGGSMQAWRCLEKFLRCRLKGYATRRNKPDLDGTSQLSPYLHFGQIGTHTVALAVQQADAPPADRNAF
jgi:deoxyribodipyrimidine photo-lyase